MGKQEHSLTGAAIERGRIAEVTEDGYRVENLDRIKLKSPVITGINDDVTCEAGDMVYFFMFRDGTGKIICKA